MTALIIALVLVAGFWFLVSGFWLLVSTALVIFVSFASMRKERDFFPHQPPATSHQRPVTMLGAIRAVVVVVCLYAIAAPGYGQPPVSPRNSYERILVVLPLIGSGTAADPVRPSLIPAPGGATPNILNIAVTAPANATPMASGPSYPRNLILGYTWVPSDDGKFALTEIVMRDRSAFPAIMALPGVTAFVKGVNKLADIQAAFQQYKKDFDPTKFGVWVR